MYNLLSAYVRNLYARVHRAHARHGLNAAYRRTLRRIEAAEADTRRHTNQATR